MSFIPSMLKSQPQVVQITINGANYVADTPITTVDTNKSIIVINGYSPNGSQAAQNHGWLKFNTGSLVRASRLLSTIDVPGLDDSVIIGTVYEFQAPFLRQNVAYFDVNSIISPIAHGLSLGPKNFGVCSGWSGRTDPTGLSNDGFAFSDITNINANTANAYGFFIVDPR